jgi:hypothetical protein
MELEFDPVAASGESTYRAPRPLELNEVSINGDADVEETEPGKFIRKGGFFRKRILIGKPRDQKPTEERIGEVASVIFLKIRRKLVQRSGGGEIVFSTNEHTAATDAVDLYDSNGFVRSGSAKAIREAYPGLRTVQIVYALLLNGEDEPEVVRIPIKGASLGSEAKDEKTTNFYDYLSSFVGEEHMWQYITELHAVLEKGQKSYFCIDFKRGFPLDDTALKLALSHMKIVHEKCIEIDKARVAKRAAGAPERVSVTPEIDPEEARSQSDRDFDAALEIAKERGDIDPDKVGAGLL